MRTLLLSLFALSACAPPDDGSGQLLWDVNRPNGARASLFGTIHTQSLDVVRDEYPDAIERLDASSVLVVEADPTMVDLADYQRRALLDDGAPGLDTQLTADEWTALVKAMHDQVPESTLRRARPWYALQLVTLADVTLERGQGWKTMDVQMVEVARARGAEVRFLESWLDQVVAVDASTDLPMLKRAIAGGLRELAFQRSAIEVEWRSGSTDEMLASLEAQTADQKQLLFAERNARWAETLEDLLKTEKREVFIAVGTGHLIYGETRLPELLRQRDFTVARRRWQR